LVFLWSAFEAGLQEVSVWLPVVSSGPVVQGQTFYCPCDVAARASGGRVLAVDANAERQARKTGWWGRGRGGEACMGPGARRGGHARVRFTGGVARVSDGGGWGWGGAGARSYGSAGCTVW